METNPEKDNIIPIERGHVIKWEKLGKRVNEKIEELLALHQRLIDAEDEKWELYSTEISRPPEAQDKKLIALFEADFQKIEEMEKSLEKDIEEGLKHMEGIAQEVESIGAEK